MIPKKENIGGVNLVFEEDRSVPIVYLYVDFHFGTEIDPEDKGGRLRLAAHLLKLGTKRKSREELNRAIESIGADLDLSAGHHHLSLSAHSISESFDALVDIVREMLHEPGLRRDDFEQVRRETIADIIESRQDDQGLAGRNFRAMLFGSHPYGRRTVGKRKNLEALSYGETADIVRSHLAKGRITIGGSGDISREKFMEKARLIVDGLSTLKMPPTDVPEPPPPRGVKVRLVDKPDRTQSQIYMGHLGAWAWDENYFPLVVLNTAFGGTFTARLSEEIRRKRGMSYGAYSRILRSRKRDSFYLWTFPSIEHAAEVIRLQLEMLEELKAKALTDEEHDFAVKYLGNHFLFAVETAPLRVSLAIREISQNLPPDFFETYRENIRGVTQDEVKEAAAGFIDPRNICISVLCTADRVRDKLEQELKDYSPSIETVPYDDD